MTGNLGLPPDYKKQTKMKIICDSCLKEKEPYFEGSNLCEDCVIKMDEFLDKQNEKPK